MEDMVDSETFVLSLGGSIIAPDPDKSNFKDTKGIVDVEFLKKFKAFILEYVEKGKRFVIITGGGNSCRRYQKGLRDVYPEVNSEGVDWLGLWVTRVNAQLVCHMFGGAAELITDFNPSLPITSKASIIVGAGYAPGHSTDTDAVLIAKNIGAKHIVNLSNIDYVYDKDPSEFSDAKKIENISWDDFIDILPKDWKPGLNSPFDPIAAREARDLGIGVAMIGGRKLEELGKLFSGKDFEGTRIE